MDAIAVLFIAFVVGPLGLLLIVIAALGLRDLRPYRAKTVCWLSIALLLVGFASMASSPPFGLTVRQFSSLIETGLIAIIVAMVLMALAMMTPLPTDRYRANLYGCIGLVFVAIGGAAFAALTQMNFTY